MHLRASEDPKEKPHSSRLIRNGWEDDLVGHRHPFLSPNPSPPPGYWRTPREHTGTVSQPPPLSWTPTKGPWIEGMCHVQANLFENQCPSCSLSPLQAGDRKVGMSAGWWSHTMERGCDVSAQKKATCSAGTSALDKWISNKQTSTVFETLYDLGALTRTS